MRSQVINPFSLWNDLKKYRFNLLKADLYSGLSVALLALPQAMAYAFLANLPPSAGIWSAVFGTIFTAAFGHSRSLVSGPTNTVAILIQSGTSVILYNFFRNATGQEREELALNIVLQLVLMIGIFQILGGFLRLGKLAQFTSRSVITGYMAGAGIAIAVNQLFPFFGIHSMRGYHPIYLEGWYLLKHLKNLHIPTTLLAAVSLGALAFFYRRASKIPIAAIVIFFASLIVFFLRLAPETAAGYDGIGQGEGVKRIILLKDLGPVFTDLPMFSLPDFDLEIIISLVPLAGAIAFISMLEVTAIGRTYSPAKESDYKDSQELFGLGVSNLLSGFLGAMPSSGSFSRSELNVKSGAKTRFSSIFSGIYVFLFVVLLGFIVTRIPIAALSALMLITAYSMIHGKNLMICLKSTYADAFVVAATFFSSLIFTLDVALYVGIGLSVMFYLKHAADSRVIEYTFNNIGKLRPLEEEDERLDPSICILQVEGELFFGAAQQLQMQVKQFAQEEHLKVIILQLLNTRYLDASICIALAQIAQYLKSTNRHLLLSGVTEEAEKVLKSSGLLEEIGEERCFHANEQLPSEPTRRAYAAAKNLVYI